MGSEEIATRILSALLSNPAFVGPSAPSGFNLEQLTQAEMVALAFQFARQIKSGG